ncbi:MAG TPA: T9SS type A sorting domain-containing protein, partial [Flavobacteriales bacterium]|nr:T9SS type A sorting domain-containing protein [Flavobacteriales bacterium]
GTVTDAAGCTYPITFTITQPTALSVSATPTAATSGCNGSISVTATGGTPGYQYSIDGGTTWQTSSTFNALCGGTYTVCVQDANGCTECVTVTVAASGCTMVTTVVPTSVSCYGACDATANVISTAGTPPYTTTIGTTTQTYASSTTFTGFCAGTYIAYTSDAAGCTTVFTFIVGGPTDIVTTATGTNPSSFGACDGSITATTSGGVSPYTYNWYDCTTGLPLSTTGATATGLCAGSYAYSVSDANGCTDSISCITLTNPTTVGEYMNEHNVAVYPNPTTGMITIRIEADGTVCQATLTDVLGQVVATSDVKHKLIFDLNAFELKNGIYFVTITGKNKAKHTQRIVLNR